MRPILTINKENVMLKEETNLLDNTNLEMLVDLEEFYRGRVQELLLEGNEDEALKWDVMANKVADDIQKLR